MYSLLDLANRHPIDVWLAFRKRTDARRNPLWKLLEPGFDHVEVWKSLGDGWLRINPTVEFLDIQAYTLPPWVLIDADQNVKYIRVKRSIPIRDWRNSFHIGPIDCVELIKAMLGIKGFFIRTPYQLFKFLKREQQHVS